MNILIPMAGAGSRFAQQGYMSHKPVIPITSRRDLNPVPMVVEAVNDLPVNPNAPNTNLLFIVRDFHIEDGVDATLRSYFPRAEFVVVNELTDGQASTCLLARTQFDNDHPLLIAACDNGMEFDAAHFQIQSARSDALVFTFRGNEAVLAKPQAYGWVCTNGECVTDVSIKQPISDAPTEDHAIVGAFWFRKGRDFFASADSMIAQNDRINGEFYVDKVFSHLLADKAHVEVCEVSRYLCWGTPEDYEAYEATLSYWHEFADKEDWVV